MKKYRVWAYETIGHYIEIDAQNKSDAYNKAMDVNVLDWTQGNDAMPIHDGRCCNKCNAEIVVPARFAEIKLGGGT